MAKKSATVKKSETKSAAKIGEVVMVYTKSSSHWYALVEPKVSDIEGIKFIEGIQVTGKQGHRMERKRTMVPFENVASIIQFETEEDLWSEPQAKLIRPTEEAPQSALLTSHEQGQPKQNNNNNNRPGRHNRHDRHNRKNHNSGGRFNERNDFNRNSF